MVAETLYGTIEEDDRSFFYMRFLWLRGRTDERGRLQMIRLPESGIHRLGGAIDREKSMDVVFRLYNF